MEASPNTLMPPHRKTSISAFVLAAAAIVVLLPGSAVAATCGPSPYPGDNASKPAIAKWMASGAGAASLPGELPVMAALVESGLANLNYGDADSVGYFQMRTSIWNKGDYAGYPKNPDLQLKWFVEQSSKVRLSWISAGKGDPIASESRWGEWIADTERPAAQYRGRYQQRLGEARELIGDGCTPVGALVLKSEIASKQRPARSGALTASVSCPDRPCNASVSVELRIPGVRKLAKLSSDTLTLQQDRRAVVRVLVRKSLRKRLKQALVNGGRPKAKLRLYVAAATGAPVTRVKTVRIVR